MSWVHAARVWSAYEKTNGRRNRRGRRGRPAGAPPGIKRASKGDVAHVVSPQEGAQDGEHIRGGGRLPRLRLLKEGSHSFGFRRYPVRAQAVSLPYQIEGESQRLELGRWEKLHVVDGDVEASQTFEEGGPVERELRARLRSDNESSTHASPSPRTRKFEVH